MKEKLPAGENPYRTIFRAKGSFAFFFTSFIARLIETNHCSNLSLSHIHDLLSYLILSCKHRSASASGTS